MISRATRAMLCATLLAAGLSLSGRVNAAFISGVWQGDANYDTEGKFSDCTMTAQASSGVLIGFIISKGFRVGPRAGRRDPRVRGRNHGIRGAPHRSEGPDPGHRQSDRRSWHRHPARELRTGARCPARGRSAHDRREKGQYQLQVDRHQGSDRRACRLRHREPHQREGRCLDRHAASYAGVCAISGARTASRCRRA